jgi:hypothetical protein
MLLAQHPQVYQKLIAELRTVLGDRTPTMTDLPQLTYANQIILEAMRLYPPITDVSREASQDCELGGYVIPQGTTLILSQWVMHCHPQYFEASATFNPERWDNDLEKQLPRDVYFPFSDGPRICIGKSFAQMEAALILATIAQNYQLELAPNQTIELQPSLTLRPKQGIQVILNPASAQFWLVALSWLVLQKNGSGVAIGTVLIAAAIPRGLFMLVGGAISDRLPRIVATLAASVNTIVIGLVALLLIGDQFDLNWVSAIAALFGVSEAFLYPAVLALLPQLIRKSQLGQANAWMQSSEQITNVIGPAAAGIAIGALGIPMALA